ncbi:unnamed protein product [Gordionus sp. m RMFG-2023]
MKPEIDDKLSKNDAPRIKPNPQPKKSSGKKHQKLQNGLQVSENDLNHSLAQLNSMLQKLSTQTPKPSSDIETQDVSPLTLQKCVDPCCHHEASPSSLHNNPHLADIPKSTLESVKKNYAFWATQPVPKFTADDYFDNLNEQINGPIIVYKDDDLEEGAEKKGFEKGAKILSLSELRAIPYPLPPGFEWNRIDVTIEDQLRELYELLSENYVEDEDNMFRFAYSPAFLIWALKPPGWRPDWHLGIRTTSSGKLVGFISAVPARLSVQAREIDCVEINFLCVHKRLRSKRVAPVLISEITRRVNACGIWYAVYTAGVVLPRPCGVARYWHRSIDPVKLVEVRFSHLTRNMTLARARKLYKLPRATTNTPGLRQMCETDVTASAKLLNEYLASKFSIYPIFTEDEFRHWFLPRPGVVETYIVDKSREITDMFSFYSLPSTIVNHPVHKTLNAAYSFYNVSTQTPLVKLMEEALIVAKSQSYDVFNALDLMENKQFLEPLKFGIGDGHLQYYLFNWRCRFMKPEEIGLVLQ